MNQPSISISPATAPRPGTWRSHSLVASTLLAAFAGVSDQLGAQDQFAPEPFGYSRMAVGDFDGDGDTDLFVGDVVGTVRLLRNDGGRTTAMPTSQGPTLNLLIALDHDGDGDLDVFASDVTGYRLWENDGAGSFTMGSAIAPAAPGVGDAAVGDFDGDGDLDLAITTGVPGSSGILRNDGGGAFSLQSLAMPGLDLRVHAGDIDADGDLDLLYGGIGGLAMRLFANNGAGTFTDVSATQLPGGLISPAAEAFVDLDADGDLDIVAGRLNGANPALFNDGMGRFTLNTSPLSDLNGFFRMAVGDINDDGFDDIARKRSDTSAGPIFFSTSDGNGGWSNAASGPSTVGFLLGSNQPVLADHDGDGDDDFFFPASVGGTLMINRHRHVTSSTASLGGTWDVEVWSKPGYATVSHPCVLAIGLQLQASQLDVPAIGSLWLDLGQPFATVLSTIPVATGTVTYNITIPAQPIFTGLDLHAQGLVFEDGTTPRLTTYTSAQVQ